MQKTPEIDPTIFYDSKTSGRYNILRIVGKQTQNNGKRVSIVEVKFENTGTIIEAVLSRALAGKVKDPYSIDVLGVGCMGRPPKNYDRRAYNTWYSMLSRCYNKNSDGYKTHGAKGVTVCERWHCFEYFYEDYQKLQGYKEYAEASEFEKGKFALDKDLLQEGLPYNKKVYSPNTCVIMHMSINSRIAIKDNHPDIDFGVEEVSNGIWISSFTNNKVRTEIGTFTNKTAAISAYNYIIRKMTGLTMNEIDNEMPIYEWVKYRLDYTPICIPSNIEIPADLDMAGIIRSNTFHHGVTQVRYNAYKASYIYPDGNEYIIGYFYTEIAAVNAYNYYCMDNKLYPINNINTDCIIPRELLKNYYTQSDEAFWKDSHDISVQNYTNRYRIGEKFQNNTGDWFEIISINDAVENISYVSVPITVRFIETGYTTTVTQRTIDNKCIKDYYKRDVLGIGYYGGEYEINSLNGKIKEWWYRMLQRCTKLCPENPASKVSTEWLCFLNFLRDFPTLPGYTDFLNPNADAIMTLGYVGTQLDIPENQRIYSKETSYICLVSNEKKYQYMGSENKDQYYGVFRNPNGTFKIAVTTKFDDKRRRSTYTDEIAAANAYNYYSQFYYGVAPNNVPYMSREEFNRYRIGKYNQLYTLRDSSTRNHDVMTIPTYESDESRNKRCLERYGMIFD